MKCEDIEKAITGESGDLESVAKHLEVCSLCAQKFSADLEFETALRQLRIEPETVDITDNLKATLYRPYKQLSRLYFIQKWVWIVTSVVAVMVLAINLPDIIKWLEYGYNSLLAELPILRIDSPVDLAKIATEVESSAYYGYIVVIVLAMFAGISARLWREFKEVIR